MSQGAQLNNINNIESLENYLKFIWNKRLKNNVATIIITGCFTTTYVHSWGQQKDYENKVLATITERSTCSLVCILIWYMKSKCSI